MVIDGACYQPVAMTLPVGKSQFFGKVSLPGLPHRIALHKFLSGGLL